MNCEKLDGKCGNTGALQLQLFAQTLVCFWVEISMYFPGSATASCKVASTRTMCMHSHCGHVAAFRTRGQVVVERTTHCPKL